MTLHSGTKHSRGWEGGCPHNFSRSRHFSLNYIYKFELQWSSPTFWGDYIRNEKKWNSFPPSTDQVFSDSGDQRICFFYFLFLFLLVKTFWMMLPPFKNDAICLTLKSQSILDKRKAQENKHCQRSITTFTWEHTSIGILVVGYCSCQRVSFISYMVVHGNKKGKC